MSATESDPITSAALGAGPAPVAERILALDAVRGFALFGILVVNVLGISGLRAFAIDETSAVEPVLRQIVQIFFQGKFVSLFSILFGISFFLLLDRLHTKNASVFPRYWRRLAILFVFGMAHVLIQPGEILMPYALCAVLLLVFYRMPWKIVLVAATILMAAPHLHTAWMTAIAMNQPAAAEAPAPEEKKAEEDSWEREVLSGRSWDPYDGPDSVRVFSKGSLVQVVAYNVEFTLDRWTTSWAGYLWITFPLPMMMIGLLVARSGVLRHVTEKKRLVHRTCWGGLAVGLALYWLSTFAFARASASGWNPWIGSFGNILFVMSAVFLALAYGATILLLFQRKSIRKPLAALGAVGRMALTNYLLQTVVSVWLFWGIGLGWYGRFGAGTVEIIAVIVFALLTAFSIVWLRYFRYGPFEWLWRCGTYWQLLPLKKPGAGWPGNRVPDSPSIPD